MPLKSHEIPRNPMKFREIPRNSHQTTQSPGPSLGSPGHSIPSAVASLRPRKDPGFFVRFTSRPTCGAQEIPGTHPCNVWRLGPSLKTWAKCHAGTSAESHCRIQM